jgi:hypothetical protein
MILLNAIKPIFFSFVKLERRERNEPDDDGNIYISLTILIAFILVIVFILAILIIIFVNLLFFIFDTPSPI